MTDEQIERAFRMWHGFVFGFCYPVEHERKHSEDVAYSSFKATLESVKITDVLVALRYEIKMINPETNEEEK